MPGGGHGWSVGEMAVLGAFVVVPPHGPMVWRDSIWFHTMQGLRLPKAMDDEWRHPRRNWRRTIDYALERCHGPEVARLAGDRQRWYEARRAFHVWAITQSGDSPIHAARNKRGLAAEQERSV